MQLSAGQFFGEQQTHIQTNHVVVKETCYRGGTILPSHWHEDPYFCIVLDGVFVEKSLGRSSECAPRVAIFHPASETHSDRFVTDGRCLNIQFRTGWWTGFPQKEFFSKRRIQAGAPVSAFVARMRRELARRDDLSGLAVECLAFDLLLMFGREGLAPKKTREPGWLARAEAYVRGRFAEKIDLSSMASELGVHPVHLSRQFRKRFGYPVGDFQRRLRVEYASKQLLSTTDSFTDIGAAAGFCDQSHFIRTFKRVIGITPTQFRNATLNRSNR